MFDGELLRLDAATKKLRAEAMYESLFKPSKTEMDAAAEELRKNPREQRIARIQVLRKIELYITTTGKVLSEWWEDENGNRWEQENV